MSFVIWPKPATAQIYENIGIRAQGMSGAFVAVADDATTTWWNPAGLASGGYFNGVIEFDDGERELEMPLFVPKPDLLRPTTKGPAHDRVVDERASGTPEELRGDLVALLGSEKVLYKVSDLVKYATDASPYRFVPQVVVLAETVEDIFDQKRKLIELAPCAGEHARCVQLHARFFL